MHKFYRRYIMKKIFALILIVFMLIPFVASCQQNPPVNTDTNTNTDTSTDTGTTDTNKPADTDKPDDGVKDPQANIDSIKESFKGQTVNILASGAFSTSGETATAGAPWGQAELCVIQAGSTYGANGGGFGTEINDAVLDREAYVEDTYGVTLNWIDCKGPAMLNRLITAAENKANGGETIHLAMPRVLEAQSIVVNNCLYNIKNSDFIDFEESYYNQEALDSYTLGDNRFFVAGDISFLDEHTSFIVFYNMTIASEFESFPDLYEMTRNGTWTINELYSLASAVSANTDNKDEWTDDDKYGFGTLSPSCFYQYFGVYQVSKKTDIDGEIYYLSVEDPKVNTIIDKMLQATSNETSMRVNWSGSYTAMGVAFQDNRLLFYHEVIQKLDYLSEDPNLRVGMLPFPKLNVEQSRYYVPSASQSTLICVPRATDDRDMSEAFIEILSKSASEYIMPAYVDKIASQIFFDYREDSVDILENYIFANMMYDQGYMYNYGGLVSSSIQGASIEGGENKFAEALLNGQEAAKSVISAWNTAYFMYSDED